MTSGIKVMCLFCGEEVGKSQEKKVKAICLDCDKEVFNTKVERTPTPMEYYKEIMKEEEEMFLKMMKRIFLKRYKS